MIKDHKNAIIIVAAIALLLAIFSGWKTLGGSRSSSEGRTNSVAGPLSPMSSMLGPDSTGKPQTQLPAGGRPTSIQEGGAPVPQSHRPGGVR